VSSLPPKANPSAAVAQALLEEGIRLAKAGRHESARAAFQQVIHAAPETEDAWLWMSWIAADKKESLRLLREAQRYFPNSTRVRAALDAIDEPPPPPLKQRVAPQMVMKRAIEPVKAVKRSSAGVGSALARLFEKTRNFVQGWRLTALSVSLIALASILLILWLSGAFSSARPTRVEALVLPTRLPASDSQPDPAQALQEHLARAETLLAGQDWDSAIAELELARIAAPDDMTARQALARAYLGRGQVALAANRLEEAQASFDEAIRLDAGNAEVHEARRALALYLRGKQAFELQDWREVVYSLSRVRKISSNYRDADAMLVEGYLGLAKLEQADMCWTQAHDALQAALEIDPSYAAAQQVMIEVNDAITPPRRVEVSLSEHLVRAYENHAVIRTMPMCAGKPGSPTRTGRFEVLDKLPMALASQWGGLQMPWWIGLYYTNDDPINGIENGFHALPFRNDRQVMWANSLGSACSYGCIVMDTPDANWLFDWVDVGTVVLILE